MERRETVPQNCPGHFMISRRNLLKSSALLGGSALLARQLDGISGWLARTSADALTPVEAGELARPENVMYSVCLQCHTACPIKGKLLDGVLVKVDGNPYGHGMLPPIDSRTPPAEAALIDGKVCPKGQSGVQTLYDPYRVVKVLKRAGPRGSNRWVVIPFDQAIDEIVNGGNLFPGEDPVPGLRDLFALRDAALAKAMAEDAQKVAAGQMSVAAFKSKYAGALDVLIDADHPDLGPKNNQFVFQAGRIEHGRKEFSKRWLIDGFGSINWYAHTTICEQSHHIAYKMLTNQYRHGQWTGGKSHMKPDAVNAEFIVFFGTGAFEANFGPPAMAQKITEGIASGRLKIAVVDPRFSKTAAKAWKWLPARPGTDAAVALGMMRWIIDNGRYDARFLENANRAAAAIDGEPSWTNATFLVKIEEGRPSAFLRASDIGMGDADHFVVSRGGQLTVVDPDESETPVEGDLFVEGVISGIRYKSAFQLLYEQTQECTVAEWAELAGVSEADLVDVARELTAHGKRAAVELYRGPVQHTNGYYNGQAIITLNLLLGNPDWKGGLAVGGGHWHELGDKPGQPFNLKTMHPGKLTAFGVKLTREKASYEKSTLFQGYPARRPWFPHTDDVYQEILPSAADAYPYPIKALFLHMGTPAFATPAGHRAIETLRDPGKIPLFIACDIVIGETSMYADYLFPDLTYMERWGTPHETPDWPAKMSKVRQPIVAPLTETVTVFGQQMPISMETVMLAIAERLDLPGFGPNGFGPGQDLTRPEDFYLRMVANIAYGDKPGDAVPEASDEEMEIFLQARRHLPSTVFDPARWQAVVGPDHWRKVVYVLNRGGRFEAFADGYDGDYMAHKIARMFNIFVEPVAQTRHSMTGEYFSGVPRFEPVKDALGRVITDEEFEFQLITFKEITGGQSRTIADYWMISDVLPENFVLINPADAARLGLSDGDRVKLVSRTNPQGVWDLQNGQQIPMVGKVKVVLGIRPGVVAVSWHYGHWAYGANDVVIDGVAINGDPRRATGLCPNAAMRVDEQLKNVCLTDPIGGSASFYDTRVNLVRA